MRIDKLYYRLNAVLGNGATENLTIVAEPEEGDSLEACFSELRERAKKAKLPSDSEIYLKLDKGQRALSELERIIAYKQGQWEDMRTFLIAQGINPDAPEMPFPSKSLPQAVDGEFVQEEM